MHVSSLQTRPQSPLINPLMLYLTLRHICKHIFSTLIKSEYLNLTSQQIYLQIKMIVFVIFNIPFDIVTA